MSDFANTIHDIIDEWTTPGKGERTTSEVENKILAAHEQYVKQTTTSLTIDGEDVKPPTSLGEYTTDELEAEIKYRREHERG